MPKRVLTAAAIERIKPPSEGQVDYFDRGYPGLALRVSYGGARAFCYFYRFNDKQWRYKLGLFPAMSLAEAREAWRLAREDLVRGRDPAATRKRDTGATNFEGVVAEWLKRDQSKNRTHDEVKRIVERVLIPAWGHRSVADIGRRDILDVLDEIADRGKLTMARRVQAYIHRFFKWCVGRGIIDSNPATALPKQGEEVRRDRVLTDDELKSLWKAADKIGWPFGSAIHLLILTGARREEIGQLRWSEVQGDKIQLEGVRTKNGEPHTIPLGKSAQAIVDDLIKVGGSDFVFTTTAKTPISGWSRVKSDLDDDLKFERPWRYHDIRRTVSTGTNELGIEPHIVEAILGHVVKGVAGVYNKAKHDTAKRAALEVWGAHVMALVEGRTPGKVVAMRGKRE